MERKQFFVVAASAGAALAATGIVAGAANSPSTAGCGPGPMPHPSGSASLPRPPHHHASSVDSAYRHVRHTVETLSKDPNDYDGHKGKALGFLEQAVTELQQAMAYEQAHPSATSSPL